MSCILYPAVTAWPVSGFLLLIHRVSHLGRIGKKSPPRVPTLGSCPPTSHLCGEPRDRGRSDEGIGDRAPSVGEDRLGGRRVTVQMPTIGPMEPAPAEREECEMRGGGMR